LKKNEYDEAKNKMKEKTPTSQMTAARVWACFFASLKIRARQLPPPRIDSHDKRKVKSSNSGFPRMAAREPVN
jgi:hypothetical protein